MYSYVLQTRRIAFDVDATLEAEIRERYDALRIPGISLTVFRMALMSAGLALDSEALTAKVWESLRQRGRPPGSGTDLANASIMPVKREKGWLTSYAKNRAKK